ncbi:MAG: alpha/beta fold hydrolase [Chloroflexi bacterium]|nr:alpha/beta fold hydrolase [Chloroflexota bacterium]
MADEIIGAIPEPLSTCDVAVDDETVITLRRHGNPSGPRLVLCHGNGLAIDLYYPFWSLLLADFDLILYDLRNHGWNSVSSLGNHTLPALVEDHDKVLAAIDAHYGIKPKVGVFHSVSALVTLLSPNKGDDFLARVLFDPPCVSRDVGTWNLKPRRRAWLQSPDVGRHGLKPGKNWRRFSRTFRLSGARSP